MSSSIPNMILRKHIQITKLLCKTGRNHVLSPTHIGSICYKRPIISLANKTWAFEKLNPSGKLILRNNSEVKVDFKVSPIDLQSCPNQDQATVTANHDDVLVCDIDNRTNVMVISTQSLPEGTKEPTTTVQCNIEVPISYNVDAELEGYSSLSVDSLENQDLDISVQQGDCHLKNIKTNTIQVRSDCGAIVSEGVLQGNISLQSHTGPISLHKPVGQTLTVETNEGNVNIKNLYALNSSLIGQGSDIHIGSCHGNTQVRINYQGNLKVGALDGTLRADLNDGHVDVMLTQTEWINIVTSRGDITLRLPESLPATVELQGDDVEFDKTLKVTNTESSKENLQTRVCCSLRPDSASETPSTQIPHIISRTKSGSVFVRCQDWLSSLNLGKH